MKSILIISFLFSVVSLLAQTPYHPVNLGGETNSKYDELKPIVGANDSIIYFSVIDHPHNKYGEKGSQDIWYSELQLDGSWTRALRMPDNVNLGRYNVVYAVLDDGKTLLINGVYNNKKRWVARGLSEIKLQEDGSWSAPEELRLKVKKVNDGYTSDYTVSPNGKYLLISSSKGYRSFSNDLFISEKSKGKWKKPKKIKVNHGKNMISPLLSENGKTLYFASKGDDEKTYEIFACSRMDDSYRKWAEPIPISDSLNNIASFDAYMTTNGDGEIAYFSSDRDEYGDIDLYKIRLKENESYVTYSGDIMNLFKNDVLSNNHEFKVVIEQLSGTPPDSLLSYEGDKLDSTIIYEKVITLASFSKNDRMMNYTFQLPFGEKYRARAIVENFISKPIEIDVTKEFEHKEEVLNLFVEPLTFAIIKGNVIDSKTNQDFLNPDSSLVITVNDQPYDSVVVQSDGSFEFKLALGDTFMVAATKDGYQSFPIKIDLTPFEEFQNIEQDLRVAILPDMNAYVTINLFNKKTGKPLEASAVFEVLLANEIIEVEKTVIDTVENSFVLKLPLDSVYFLSIESEDYVGDSDTLDFIGETTEKMKVEKDFYLEPIEIGSQIVLENIEFKLGSAELIETSFPALDVVAGYLHQHGKMKIEIGGHTDNQGSGKLNKKLSQDRAQTVTDYLFKKGVATDRITVKGYGFDKPIDTNETKEGRAKNRRVEFTILDK